MTAHDTAERCNPTPTADVVPLALGQPVQFTATLRRTTEHRPIEGDKYSRVERWRTWHPRPNGSQGEPTDGILIGVRTLANGPSYFEYDEGYVFASAERFPAYLVAFDVRRKPVLVLPEHIRPLPNSTSPDQREFSGAHGG